MVVQDKNDLKHKIETFPFPQAMAVHPSLLLAWERICEVHQMYSLPSRNKGQLIFGLSGEGKTFLVNNYQQHFPPIVTTEKKLIPVFYCRFKEAKKSIDDILRFLISALGVSPPKGRTRAGELSAQFYKLIDELGVQLIILDEIQQVLPEKDSVTALNTLKYFCGLLDELPPSIVFIGSERASRLLTFGQTDKTVDENEQLSRRMFRSIQIGRLAPCSDEWLTSINWFVQKIGLEPLTYSDGDLLDRIYIAYGHGRSMSTLDDLFLRAPFHQKTKTELTCFLFKNFEKHCHKDENPFSTEHFSTEKVKKEINRFIL
ncbi:TniB family NTP-binding protein [Shewanella sp. 3_MG-2023]|uniref:TniB family NTP-binding protein n=1 Tax=Shewanella sp. 3_MG-2023 TaxID=3062635 RepID=UPI0026E38631|nr:TniB family NTP-binding protein [Shewanella sp. 3_MG-2023]MDO6776236.1 TniB family NTP-binding protein [Shewanella sp. 3_MG-2023]